MTAVSTAVYTQSALWDTVFVKKITMVTAGLVIVSQDPLAFYFKIVSKMF